MSSLKNGGGCRLFSNSGDLGWRLFRFYLSFKNAVPVIVNNKIDVEDIARRIRGIEERKRERDGVCEMETALQFIDSYATPFNLEPMNSFPAPENSHTSNNRKGKNLSPSTTKNSTDFSIGIDFLERTPNRIWFYRKCNKSRSTNNSFRWQKHKHHFLLKRK